MFNIPLTIAVLKRDFRNLNKEGRKMTRFFKKFIQGHNVLLEYQIVYLLLRYYSYAIASPLPCSFHLLFIKSSGFKKVNHSRRGPSCYLSGQVKGKTEGSLQLPTGPSFQYRHSPALQGMTKASS